jgi:hypothetical protein
MTTFLSRVSPKVCQGDRGPYILDLYGTDGYQLLAWGFMSFRQSGLVTGKYVEHCFVGKGSLQAPSISLKGEKSEWVDK